MKTLSMAAIAAAAVAAVAVRADADADVGSHQVRVPAPARLAATLQLQSSRKDCKSEAAAGESAPRLSALDVSSPSWWPSFLSRSPVPLLLWHGLGDSAYSDGIQDLKTQLEANFPGLFVYVIHLGDDAASDRNQGFFGNVNQDIELVCQQLDDVSELQDRKGSDGKVVVDAMGFSQGGQFSRALAQRCPGIKVRNLVTFGSQHMGISDLPTCQPSDLLCRVAQGALKTGVFTDYAQSKVVTAQYYRNPLSYAAYQRYLETNHFLTDINNEIDVNQTYKKVIAGLDNFVMLQFDEDKTVVPRRSGWFESYPLAEDDDDDGGDDDEEGKEEAKLMAEDPIETIPLRQSELYKSDRLGLKLLDTRGGLILDVCHGRHMSIDEECWSKVVGKYIGTSQSLLPTSVGAAWNTVIYQVTGIQSVTTFPAAAQLSMLLMAILVTRIAILLVSTVVGQIRSRRTSWSEGKIQLP